MFETFCFIVIKYNLIAYSTFHLILFVVLVNCSGSKLKITLKFSGKMKWFIVGFLARGKYLYRKNI